MRRLSGPLWYICRLRAMSLGEVRWRLGQKALQWWEYVRFSRRTAVTERVFSRGLRELRPFGLGLNLDNREDGPRREVSLLGGYAYERYRTDWHAGFQTAARWPLEWSYRLQYKQREDIGDARTNWELNRHHQLALLAKGYYAAKDAGLLAEFQELFHSWNRENPFLYGIAWTSTMEAAIRSISWMYSLAFLRETDAPPVLLEELRVGILNLTDHVMRHRSRYSSANNHLVVELSAVGLAGVLFQHRPWLDFAVTGLSREFPRQNHPDGVNREQSLHYHSFYLEAVALLGLAMTQPGRGLPEEWVSWLERMSGYLRACLGLKGETVAFGDGDEGKLLDLDGRPYCYYRHVLGLVSLLLPRRYVEPEELTGTARWLASPEALEQLAGKPLYRPSPCMIYPEGGAAILRGWGGGVLIGMDFGPLGFGSLAAHGHADALSIQLFVEGVPVFMDPGTYLYHTHRERRDALRRTRSHNTISLDGRDQAEMLGPFLWGRRYGTTLLRGETAGAAALIEAEQDGYAPVIHRRRLAYDGAGCIKLTDMLTGGAGQWESVFLLGPQVTVTDRTGEQVSLRAGDAELTVTVRMEQGRWDGGLSLTPARYAPRYGVLAKTTALRCGGTHQGRTVLYTEIQIRRGG